MEETIIFDRINKLRTTLDNSINTLRTELVTSIQTEINRLELPKVHHKVTNNYVDLSTKLESIHKELSEKLLSLDNFVKDNFLSLKKEFNGKISCIEARIGLLESKETVTKDDINSLQNNLLNNINSIKQDIIKLNTIPSLVDSKSSKEDLTNLQSTLGSTIKTINKELNLLKTNTTNSMQECSTSINSLEQKIGLSTKQLIKQEQFNKEIKEDIFNLLDNNKTLKADIEQVKYTTNSKITEITNTITGLSKIDLVSKLSESLELLKTKLDIGLCNNSKIVNNHKELIENILVRLNTIENKPNKELTRQDILKLLTIDGIVSFDSMMKLPFIPLPNSLQDTSNLVIAGDIKDKRVKLFVNGNWVIIA